MVLRNWSASTGIRPDSLISSVPSPSFRHSRCACSHQLAAAMLDLPKPGPDRRSRDEPDPQAGLASLPAGVERYRIRGQGSIAVAVEAGDEITLIDVEGGQPCEVCHVDASGRFDAAALGARSTNGAPGLKAVLAGDDESGRRRAWLSNAGRSTSARRRRCRCSATLSRPARQATFPVLRDGLVLVVAPGRAMDPGEQTPRPPIELLVKRRRKRSAKEATSPARAAGRSAAGHPDQGGDRPGLCRQSRRIHPGHRCRRPADDRIFSASRCASSTRAWKTRSTPRSRAR